MTQYHSDRIVYLDLIRILATFGVITLHVYSAEYISADVGCFNWYIAAIGDSLVRWSVPLFVMISGALFLHPDKKITFQTLIRKYVLRLLLIYIFWNLAYSAFHSMRYFIHGREWCSSLLTPYFHLWYLPMLIGVYLLIPILRKIAAEKKLLRVTLILWIIYLTGCFCGFNKIPQVGILFSENSIVGYAGYYLLGYHISNYKITKKQARWSYILGILGAFICIGGNIFMSYAKAKSDETFLNGLGPHNVAMASALFIFIKQITPKIENKVIKFVEYVRKDLFGIYLTHALWLFVAKTTHISHCCNVLITLPLITIAVFVLSLYTTKIIRRIPYFRKVVE